MQPRCSRRMGCWQQRCVRCPVYDRLFVWITTGPETSPASLPYRRPRSACRCCSHRFLNEWMSVNNAGAPAGMSKSFPVHLSLQLHASWNQRIDNNLDTLQPLSQGQYHITCQVAERSPGLYYHVQPSGLQCELGCSLSNRYGIPDACCM